MNTINSITAKMILVIGIAGITVSSCQKERTESGCDTTMNNIAGTYKLTSLKYKASASSPEQDYMLFFDACEKDDLIKLNANGTYEYKDAGTVCTPDGNDNGTWSLTNNQLYSDGMLGGEVESFDCKKLVTVLKDLNVNGDRITFTMEKQ
jgi:hypothetical protein